MNKLNSSQAKQLREIAAYLKQKRIDNSLSLEQIASRTFIRLHILEALETAQVEELPELIYVQGFIRRYAEILHIDGNSLAKRLSQTDSAVAVETPPQPKPQVHVQSQPKPQVQVQSQSQPQPQLKVQPQPQVQVQVQVQPKPEDRVTQSEPTEKQVFQPHWLLMAIIGCLGASLGLLYALTRSPAPETVSNSSLPETPVKSTVAKPPQPNPKATTTPVDVGNESPPVNTSSKEIITKPTQEKVTLSPSLVATPPQATAPKPTPQAAIPSPSPVATPPQATAPKPESSPVATQPQATAPKPESSLVATPPQVTGPLSVAVALDGTSWLKIQVDGKTEYEGILEEGVKQNWTAKEKLTIIAGNAGAVSYSVNQQPIQRLGELGEVKELKLTPTATNPTP